VRLYQREIDIPATYDGSLLAGCRETVSDRLPQGEVPVRFAVTRSGDESLHCELGVLADLDQTPPEQLPSVFEFLPRRCESAEKFNTVLLVPTGIGAEIGGHAGDAGPVARLLASACDTLITHPNVVNASDINELPENALYVEGSVISRMLMGTAGLQPVRSNRVILVIDEHEDLRLSEISINAVSAARAAMGLDCPLVVRMSPPLYTTTEYSSSGTAVGRVEGLERLCEVLGHHRSKFDAVAIASVIDVPKHFHGDYYGSHGKMVNPWGGVEAMLTHAVSTIFDVPSAHGPMMESMEILGTHFGIVDPRMAAEVVSTAFIHSVLKGLHRSPRIITDRTAFARSEIFTAADVSCLVIPDGCVGLPTLAALEQGIPVIAVKENKNRMRNDLTRLPFAEGKLFIVDNYLEAVGIMAALKSGVAPSSVRRPLADTLVVSENAESTTEDARTSSAPSKAE